MTDKLDPNTKIDVEEILQDLENYHPPRKGWTWRTVPKDGVDMGGFHYRDMSEPLENSVPMPTAKYFEGIDPQPIPVVTSEIASGHFEDDIRRMRMAAWNGADHIMVIRTTGQSHIDGLMEGTPEGIGGVPITRKQLRASRKACDLIEEEVGRPINFHSYVSGIAGPEVAVLFAEEGVNGAHQDPQYNVLYRNINAYRSYVDAGEAKKVMTGARIFQIDGAHNANATARHGWKVMPELMVQHGLNSAFSAMVGMPKDLIGLSTVPPSAPPTPKLWYDLPYAVALRDFFSEYKMRAQQNTRYIESDINEAIRLHVIDTLISMLTSADIQSTITPDEGRNLPWHYNSVRGVQTVKQTWAALDGIKELLTLNREGPLGEMVRDLKERAIGFLAEMLHAGGYFAAVEQGFFVDSAEFPERNHDGIARDGEGGIAVGTVIERDPDYLAPVCDHFGNNSLPAGVGKACDLIGGCTLCDPEKIVYIDELDPEDNAHKRLERTGEYRTGNLLRPEAEWAGDGVALVELMIPERAEIAVEAALEMARRMGLGDPEVVNLQVLQPAEGCFVEVKGHVGFDVDKTELTIPEKIELLPEEELRQFVTDHGITVVAGTVGEDEHSVGMREILDIKHGGLEKYGVKYHYLGTSVPIEKMVDAAIESGADAILISTVISHNEVHRTMMKKLAELTRERGIRDQKVLIAGGTQVSRDMAAETGLDATFGRGTKGIDVLDAIVRTMRGRELGKAG
ncbi:D-ornithine 4,5-aminomutase subunit OraE [Arachnia rubra]|jgi:D-ornithine aminomutase E component|uniref:Cobalamin-dependent protein n=1 Tax=Arachnia rubra TaxID=1547448 RepID=A0ABX7Y3C6_9ACTN|nr:D-ornithine 4,5-aminomutase subunit OraE [Arachnia rubra]MBB1575793.1 cobalamin B12-binding domain-containing protein [Propionibacterium sp.]QUC07365.1 cobalamin-dependent protein [Arachnia rubra]BCR81645.1 LuxR family transcriptional regulator [Arachnia rubra]